jgi:deoxyribonuclease-4
MIGSSVITRGGLPNGFACGDTWGCQAIQIYVALSRTWDIAPLAAPEVAAFSAAWASSNVRAVLAHASLLLNLASADPVIRNKSIRRLIAEIERCEAFAIPSIVIHPGSHPDLEAGIDLIASALNTVLAATRSVNVLLETVAGQGNSIGHRFEHLASILERVTPRHRVGVCLDTCHVFAAGYDLRRPSGYRSVLDEFERIIGIEAIQAFHLNDSKSAFASRVDRHAELIGEGHIGLAAMHCLLHDQRFSGLPIIVEAPRGEVMSKPNMDVLRKLLHAKTVKANAGLPVTLFDQN